MDAVILAGGFGTRLRSRVPDVPKPLTPIGGRPFLDHQLEWMAAQGIGRVVLAVHYMAERVIAYAESRDGRPLSLIVVREDEPLGTGGAARNALEAVAADGDWLVVNGDTFFAFDLASMTKTHGAAEPVATVAVSEVDDVARFGTVALDRSIPPRIVGFRQATGRSETGFVNAGAYMIDSQFRGDWPAGGFSLEKDLFPALAASRRLAAHRVSKEGFFDFGVPEAYDTIQNRFR